MDLDYESDLESRASGYECDGNSDDDAQRASTWHGKLRKQRRVIDDDDDDDDDDGVNKEVESRNTEEPKVAETERGEECKDDMEGKSSGEKKLSESTESEGKKEDDDQTAKKPDDPEPNTGEANLGEKVASSASETETDVSTSISASQPQNTALAGSKIHPHSRIATVAPVARNQPVDNMNNYRTPTSYPPEGVFPNPPNYDMIKPQFPAKQMPNYLGSNFGSTNLTAANITGNNFAPPNSSPGMLQSGASFPGTRGVGVPNTRTNFGGPGFSSPTPGAPNFPATNQNFSKTKLAGQSIPEANFGGSFAGELNNLQAGVGTNFGGATNLGGNNAAASALGGFGTMKSPTQTAPGSFWGGQNELNSLYNYQGFPQSAGAQQAPVTRPVNNQTLPPPYPAASQFAESSQYGGYNQQFQANSNMQNNYVASRQSGNFPDSSFFPATPQQPPPPYSANNSLNVNFYANPSQESNNFAGQVRPGQWTFPEGYGYYPGQGNAAGQSF